MYVSEIYLKYNIFTMSIYSLSTSAWPTDRQLRQTDHATWYIYIFIMKWNACRHEAVEGFIRHQRRWTMLSERKHGRSISRQQNTTMKHYTKPSLTVSARAYRWFWRLAATGSRKQIFFVSSSTVPFSALLKASIAYESLPHRLAYCSGHRLQN